MEFRILDITSASSVRVKAAQASVIVPSNELIGLADDEFGFLEGKFADHKRGIYMQGGVINPGWKGKLTIELLINGECDIKKGQKIAHAIILKGTKQSKTQTLCPKCHARITQIEENDLICTPYILDDLPSEPGPLPSLIYATAWAKLYNLFGEQLNNEALANMDVVLAGVEADYREGEKWKTKRLK